MSPHLRNLLEEAADDGGRPVGLDLAAVRSAGRRATWRQRAIVGGGAVGAAAVITSVALVLAPGGPALFGPATPSAPDATPTSMDDGEYVFPGVDALEEALSPLIDDLRDRGYDVEVEYSAGEGSASSGGESDAGGATSTGLAMKKEGAVGAAVVAEFTDRSALWLAGNLSRGTGEPLCAVVPVLADEFIWKSCDPYGGGGQYLFATGGDDVGDAVGVTLVRSDGSGISVTLSTAAYDPTLGTFDRTQVPSPAPPLGSLPLTHLELVAIVDQLDARAPLAPPMPPEPTASPGPPSDLPCFGDAPPAECLPMDGGMINIEPLIESLDQAGLELVTLSESAGDGVDDSSSSTVLQLVLSDGAGRAGSAAVGVYSDLAAAARLADGGQATGAGAPWCAVAPVERSEYAWYFSGDPPAFCTGLESSGTDESRILLHDEEDADAVAATLVRADGSVVSVSVSQASPPSDLEPGHNVPLAEVPLATTEIRDVLALLDAANPVS